MPEKIIKFLCANPSLWAYAMYVALDMEPTLLDDDIATGHTPTTPHVPPPSNSGQSPQAE